MKHSKKKIRKPKDFNLNCMNVFPTIESGIKGIDLYINGHFEDDFSKVKKFHDALGKALAWASIEKDKLK